MSLTFTQFLYISVIEKGNDCITAYSDLADERISHEQVPEPVIELRHARFIDISFLYEGSEIEPDAPVSVELTYDRPDLDDDSFDIYSDVIHFADDMTVIMESESKQEILSEDVDSDTMKFETESFSSYGILFYNVADHNIGNMLDGMSFALLKWEGTETSESSQTNVPALMVEYKQPSRLDLKTVTVYPKSMIDTDSDVFTHYALTDSDVTEWTFTWIEDNNYYITAQVDGVTKYLSVYSEKVSDGGRLELLDEPNEYSVITIQNNGTEGRVGKLRFVNKDDWALNKKRL